MIADDIVTEAMERDLKRETELAEIDWRIANARKRCQDYEAKGNLADLFVERRVLDRILDERFEAMTHG